MVSENIAHKIGHAVFSTKFSRLTSARKSSLDDKIYNKTDYQTKN